MHLPRGLSAVRIDGGIAGNVIPDAASLTVNFRFAPDRTVEEATKHVYEVFDGLDVEIELTDSAGGALPGLTAPPPRHSSRPPGTGAGEVRLDRRRAVRSAGHPAVNYGPGDPNLAHRVDERVDTAAITAATDMLRRYLTG